MRDLEVLAERVRDAQARSLITEAVRSYQVGAFRAAVLSIWVAVTVDLIAKIRHLAEIRDSASAMAIDKLDNAIKNGNVRTLQSFERDLLQLCESELQLLTSREATELRRLSDDRNLCAHPAFVEPGEHFRPTPELVRSHLASAVDAVLGQPAVAGKSLVETFQREIESGSWPNEHLRDYLRERYFERARPSVRRNIVELIIKGCITPVDTEATEIAQRHLNSAHAVCDIDPELFKERLHSVLTKYEASGRLVDVALIRLVGSLGTLEVLWTALGRPTKLRLIALLSSVPVPMAIFLEGRLFAAGVPSDPEVAALYRSILGGLDSETLDSLTVRPYERGQFATRSLRLLADSASFRIAEANMTRVLRTTSGFTLSHVMEFGTILKSNGQVRKAADMPMLVLQAFEDTKMIPGAKAARQTIVEQVVALHEGSPDDPSGHYLYPDLAAAVEASSG